MRVVSVSNVSRAVALYTGSAFHPSIPTLAKRTIVVLACLAGSTAGYLRTDSNTVANFELGHLVPDFDDLADDLMSRDHKLGLERPPAT